MNTVHLFGNLTRDPVLSFLPSKTAVVEFGMAMNRKFKKQDGTTGEEVCYVDLTMFGKRAEVINKYFHKGNAILVTGRLKYESWDAQDGTKRNKLVVLVENFEFVGEKNDRKAPDNRPTGNDDDIPF